MNALGPNGLSHIDSIIDEQRYLVSLSKSVKRLGRLQPHAGRAELNVTLSEAGCLLLRVELAAMGDRRWA